MSLGERIPAGGVIREEGEEWAVNRFDKNGHVHICVQCT